MNSRLHPREQTRFSAWLIARKKGGPLGVAWPCRVFSNFGDGSRSTPHRDRAIGADVFSGAKRIVVRCGGCRKSTERLSGEPHADRHAANGGTSFHLDPFLRKTFTADAPTVYASA